jgi:ATP-dependent Lhr-like helicase
MIKFLRRGDGHLFDYGKSEYENFDRMTPQLKTLYQFLKENGASHLQDIETGTNLSPNKIRDTLGQAIRMGIITTTNYDSFLSMIGPHPKKSNRPHGRTSRLSIRQNVQKNILLRTGHWLLTSSFAVMGKKISIDEKLERQARLLLLRYGILVKEFYRGEVGFLPWYQLFQILKRMEWQGEIRRGYFIEGLSGIQFALPEAIDLLSALPPIQINVECNIISTLDPALPFGGNIDWKISKKNGEKLDIRRAPGNHLIFLSEEPVLYSENYGNRLWMVKSLKNSELEIIFNTFKNWLRLPEKIRARKKIEIEFIDGESAVKSDIADIFCAVGFEKEGTSIVLWPSGL